MKKISLLIIMALVATCVALAQTPPQSQDELGAHNGYGRGCVMCHAPHSGSLGNGIATTDTQNGEFALWGQNLTPLYGVTFNFGGGAYPVTLPAAGTLTSATDANTVILECLSCHDGVTAKVSMMIGHTVEPLPIVAGGTAYAPTLLATAAPALGAYTNDHPVGMSANVSCGAPYNWDCTGGGAGTTKITIPAGSNMSKFIGNYPGSFWANYYGNGKSYPLGSFSTTSAGVTTTNSNAVTCTTCHNQHSETAYAAYNGSYYPTMFFVKGWYDPTSGGNSVAQFCRNCHGGNSNESVGVYGVTTH